MTGMTLRRFDWTLRARGCTVATWPAAEREAALRLLRQDAAARSLLADAMATEDAPEPDATALSRMRAVVHRALMPPTPVVRGVRWGAIVACLAAGLYLGLPAIEVETGAEPTAALGPTMQVDSPATVLAALD